MQIICKWTFLVLKWKNSKFSQKIHEFLFMSPKILGETWILGQNQKDISLNFSKKYKNPILTFLLIQLFFLKYIIFATCILWVQSFKTSIIENKFYFAFLVVFSGAANSESKFLTAKFLTVFFFRFISVCVFIEFNPHVLSCLSLLNVGNVGRSYSIL